jgi:hypothetical protein
MMDAPPTEATRELEDADRLLESQALHLGT